MVTTKVSNYVTINGNGKEVSLGKDKEMNFKGTGDIITEKHLPIFQVLRAKDGDATTFSRRDLRKAYKDEAIMESFGYKMEKIDRNNYTLTSNEGEEITFKFETLKEKVSRKWNEFKTERAEIRAAKKAERAAKKEAKYQEKLQKNAEKYQEKYEKKYDIEVAEKGYYVTLKEGNNLRDVAFDLGADPYAVAKENRNHHSLIDNEHVGSMIGYIDAINGDTNDTSGWTRIGLEEGETYFIPIEK